jgi:hypothetical protein
MVNVFLVLMKNVRHVFTFQGINESAGLCKEAVGFFGILRLSSQVFSHEWILQNHNEDIGPIACE